jgi:hypothetical protein
MMFIYFLWHVKDTNETPPAFCFGLYVVNVSCAFQCTGWGIELRHRHDIQNILCLVSLRAVYSSQGALHTISLERGPLVR